MKAVFIELPAFERHRADYLDDTAFGRLQDALMKNPEAGDVIQGTGGLRKMRFADSRRGKGKRGGLRVIYYWWGGGMQFWLYTFTTRTRWQISRRNSEVHCGRCSRRNWKQGERDEDCESQAG